MKRAPWVLRHCPENKRDAAVMVFTFAGLIAHIIFFAAGFLGILLIPLLLAAQYPDAPVAAPMRWLRAHFSRDTAIFVYVVVACGVAGGLNYAIIVLDYLRYDASERQKGKG